MNFAARTASGRSSDSPRPRRFVHYSVIQENGYRVLNEGELVEFECVKGPKGLQAQNVSRG